MSEKALEAKNRGNKFFQEKEYEKAIEAFTEALQHDPNDPVFYSNRSACYSSLGQYQQGLEDAQKCVEMKPAWSRGYTRKGLSLFYLERYDEAIQCYEQGLNLEPENAQLKEGLQRAKEMKAQNAGAQNPFAQIFSPQMIDKARKHPKTAHYFQQQDFCNLLQLCQQNPQFAQAAMQDQRFMDVIQVMLEDIMPGGMQGAGQGPEGQHQHQHGPDCSHDTPESVPHQPKYEQQYQQRQQHRSAQSQEDQHKQQAEEAKNQGNTFYKNKQFQEALQKYDEAIQIYPKDITYVINKAAVHFELKEYQQCIALCDQAIKEGREFHQDFQKIAKAFARKANAYMQLQDYQQAISNYQDSLLEFQDYNVKKHLQKAEQLYKQKSDLEYINPELSDKHREEGNRLFQNGDFPKALREYEEAVKRNPNDAKGYSNRAACLMKLMEFARALLDIEKCLKLDPKFIKGHIRKGNCHFAMKEYHKALEAFQVGLKLDPENQEMKEGLQRVMLAIQTQAPDEERVRHAMADPEIQSIMSDPKFSQVLRDLQENPSSVQSALKDPKIMAGINKLIAAGVIKMG